MAELTFNTNLRAFGIKKESVVGTPETITTADLDMRVSSVEVSSYEVEFDEESGQFLNGKMTKEKAVAGVARGTIDFSINIAQGEFNFDDTGAFVDSKFPLGKALGSAGLEVQETQPTDVGSEDGDWKIFPSMNRITDTYTASLIEKRSDGTALEYKVAGGMSTLTIEAGSVGSPITASFSISGKAEDLGDTDIPFDESNVIKTTPVSFLNTKVEIHELDDDGNLVSDGEIGLCVSTFSLDTGITLAEILCQSDATGFLNNTISDRQPTITVNPLLKSKADFDFWNSIKSNKTYKIGITQTDKAGNTTVYICVPRGQIKTTSNTDDNGFRRNELTFAGLTNIAQTDSMPQEADWYMWVAGVNKTIA